LTFSLYAYRFAFRALETVRFTPGSAANVFRGAFGRIFRAIACRPECTGAKSCAWRAQCAYARLFEPAWQDGPSGFADAPRPFVIRASALDGRTFAAGGGFPIDIHVFDLGEPVLEYLVRAFLHLATEGIGTGRGRVALENVHTLTASREPGACVYQAGRGLAPEALAPMQLSMAATAEPPSDGAILRFLTPTELKSGGRVLADAPFEAVFARARDRVRTVSSLYGAAPIEMEFQAMSKRAAAIETVSSDLERIAVKRRSSRTGQVHPLGGLVGEVRYAGDISEFLPILRAAYWTGIGRQTVWGKGMIEVIPIPPATAVIAPARSAPTALADLDRVP
jgi:hypothetical protein